MNTLPEDTKVIKIYKYTSKTSGKVYIGQTQFSLEERAGKNGCNYDKCIHFWNAIQLYGWDDFVGEILCYGVGRDDANYWEKHFIYKYDATNINLGYNLKDGGANGKHSEETIQKIVESNKKRIISEETRQKKSLSMRGKNKGKIPWNKNKTNVYSEETIQKMSIAHSGENNSQFGKSLSETTRQKISNSIKNEKHPNYGKTLGEETKDKISKSHSGKVLTEKHKNKISEAHKKRLKSQSS